MASEYPGVRPCNVPGVKIADACDAFWLDEVYTITVYIICTPPPSLYALHHSYLESHVAMTAFVSMNAVRAVVKYALNRLRPMMNLHINDHKWSAVFYISKSRFNYTDLAIFSLVQ